VCPGHCVSEAPTSTCCPQQAIRHILHPQVDQPLCVECAGKVVAEVDAATRAAQKETAAYEAALQRLQAEPAAALPEPEFAARLAQAQAEERAERCVFRFVFRPCCQYIPGSAMHPRE